MNDEDSSRKEDGEGLSTSASVVALLCSPANASAENPCKNKRAPSAA
jgi:hypothetical protein